jgi:hypothetical protein
MHDIISPKTAIFVNNKSGIPKMKISIFLLAFFSPLICFSQKDTIFIRHNNDWTANKLAYTVDTVIFESGMRRHILTGTTILPFTHAQREARYHGYQFTKVNLSPCRESLEESYFGKDHIDLIQNDDSSLVVEMTIYDNCCYSFLCDSNVPSDSTLNLTYIGYGTYCDCDCCFGLTYSFTKDSQYSGPGLLNKIKWVSINGDLKTIKRIR